MKIKQPICNIYKWQELASRSKADHVRPTDRASERSNILIHARCKGC